MNSVRLTTLNKNANIRSAASAAIVKGQHFNILRDDVETIETNLATTQAALDVEEAALTTHKLIWLASGGWQANPYSVEFTDIVTIDGSEIVGTSALDIGHVDGALLVASPSSDYVLEFVSAVFIYDYDTAAYTGGADDIVVQIGAVGTQVTVSSAITGADLLEAAGDKILRLGAIATETIPLVGGDLSIAGTALTDPGTAAGVLRVHITYRIHTTQL